MSRKKNNFNKLNLLYILIFFIGIFLYLYNFGNLKKIIKNNENNEKKVEKINTKKDEKQIKNISIYKKFDLETDDSITKFINNKISFKNKKYIPENLENVRHMFIYSTKNNSAVLRKEAREALKKLSLKFGETFNGEKIKVISGYRSYKVQKRIQSSGACENNLCAKAGYSEHQTGLAVDLWEADTEKKFLENEEYKKYFLWMQKNAHKYGFTNTYIKGDKIDGYQKEPWHWRYVGVELASYLKQQDMSFAEFYNESKK